MTTDEIIKAYAACGCPEATARRIAEKVAALMLPREGTQRVNEPEAAGTEDV